MTEEDTDAATRAQLERNLVRLEAEHREVLKAGLSIPGGVYFSQRLHELEDEADLIRVQLGIPPRGSLRDRVRDDRAAVDADVAAGRDARMLGGPRARRRATRAERWGGMAMGFVFVLIGLLIGASGQWQPPGFVLIGGGVVMTGAHVVLILRARRSGRPF